MLAEPHTPANSFYEFSQNSKKTAEQNSDLFYHDSIVPFLLSD
jgi:hypothetical protein